MLLLRHGCGIHAVWSDAGVASVTEFCFRCTPQPADVETAPAPAPAFAPARAGIAATRQCNDRSVTADNVTAQDEVVDICRDLIRIDTSNPGDHSGPGERQAAEYTAAKLSEAGLEPTVLESHPKRTSVVARLDGENPNRPALLVHGHLDVVPANAEDWQRPPFSAVCSR